jgi:hypothetical protein
MPNESVSPEKDELGYSLSTSEDPAVPDDCQLKIVLRPIPTEQHFDPEIVTCSIASASGSVEDLRVHHPWLLGKTYRVCAGHVILQDRKGRQVTAFTFGGELRIESTEARTICRLLSPVSILDYSQPDSMAHLLGEEVEILLAERRAAWLHNPAALDRRLAEADPHSLYLACIAALREKFARFPAHHSEPFSQLVHFVNHQFDNTPDISGIDQLL